MKLPVRALLSLLAAPALGADANRLTYLDDSSPFWPTASSPRFTTPQWIGESGVDAAVILAIDDMRGAEPGGTAKYEAFLRPILERLKRIDGRAPVSIMTCTAAPEDPQLQSWLKEGVSLEVHTLTHPCPCLGKIPFEEASRTYHGGVDLMASIPNNKPVAFRMPCCDSMNSVSPRFYAEILNRASEGGNSLAIDSSVFVRPPGERFAKYFPTELRPPIKLTFENYAGYIEDYPYPYIMAGKCWEFPCMVPSDWEAFNLLGPKSDAVLADWKAALDYTVEKKGVFTAVLHPHGWSAPEQWVAFIEYAQKTYGRRVKFLNFREALERLEKHALAGTPLRPDNAQESSVRMLDLDRDGSMDVVTGNALNPLTRIWDPTAQTWRDFKTPVTFGGTEMTRTAFAILRKSGMATLFASGTKSGAWHFDKDGWRETPALTRDLPAIERAQFRDFDGDGTCEVLSENGIFAWNPEAKRWRPAEFELPPGCVLANAAGRDNGLRFIDLNGDGFDDIIQSNDAGFGIYLWAATVRADLGWKRGWSHVVSRGPAASDPATARVLPFVKEGRNYGGWFHQGHIVWQNEDTFPLAAHVLRRSFKELIAFDVPSPKTPDQGLKSLQPRPGFIAELVASEPLIQDPVAFDWDAQGRLWVVEMRDYPSGVDGKGKPGGVINILTDEDADGRYDKALEFARDLAFPTGVFPWREGVLVAATPEILFLRDTDGDGRSDHREVLFTGFKEGNQQHRMNGFTWGLDGWIYGANGDSGGNVRAAARKFGAVSISGRDFRFRPDTGEFEAESGMAQFGRYRDDWGNWFGNNNSTWLWHYTVEERYLRRNPKLAVKSTRRMLAGYADATRVFPGYSTENAPIRFNQPQSLGHVTSACSPAPYRDDLFGPKFGSSIFISEPVHNAIHREVLVPDGASFASGRADDELEREFLASSDPWFRPVMAKTGPDGALYIADMYRFVLEHPEWIAPETQSRLDLRAGSDKGRIYRVFPEGVKLPRVPNLASLDNAALAAALDSTNGWQRDTVHRLLIERSASDSAPVLARMACTATNPKVRLQAIAALASLGRLELPLLEQCLRDAHPAVRRQAVRACEDLQVNDALTALLKCVDDPDFTVRRQVALSLGEFRDPRANAALERLAARDSDREEMRISILSSVAPESPLYAKLNSSSAARAAANNLVLPKASTPDRAQVVASYAPVANLTGAPARGRELFQQQCALCHKLKREGQEVGPDLSMVHDKPLDWLLTAIFDPNAAIEDRYRSHSVRLKSGAVLAGIITAETGNNIVVKLPGGAEIPVLRAEIANQQTTSRSLMPDGLETVLTPQDVADLVAWLRAR